MTVPVPSSYRPLLPHRERPATAAFAALALLAIGSTSVIASPALPSTDNGRSAVPLPVQRAPTRQDLIEEASRRFSIPARWIAEVMAVESRGDVRALSPKGAIGLMQIMPETYAGLRLRYGLGPNPWNPRDNVFAGAAYLRELYDRYGAPGFLAAYNAGPGRWDDYRLHGRPLAAETVAYLGRLAPVVGGSMLPMPTLDGVAAPRSPFSAPIFVALSTDPARVEARTERARIVRIVEANASVVGRADAVFVTRTRTAQQPSSSAPPADDAAAGQLSSRSSTDTAAPVTSPSDSLFPDRREATPPR